jgi:hypothetical protein
MKIDTTTILLGVAAVAAIYLITRPATPAVPAYNPYLTQPVYGSAANPYAGNTTAQDIAAGGSALNALGTALGNFF